jgi:hypothetical protein
LKISKSQLKNAPDFTGDFGVKKRIIEMIKEMFTFTAAQHSVKIGSVSHNHGVNYG